MYAARDAFVTIELFKLFANRLEPGILDIPKRPICCRELLGDGFIDVKYTYEYEFDKLNRGYCVVESMRWLAYVNKDVADMSRRVNDVQRSIGAMKQCIIDMQQSIDGEVSKHIFN